MNMSPLWISLKVALFSTMVTIITGTLAAGLVLRRKRGRAVWDAVFSLPLVLPPTVVGFILLLLFGKDSLFGKLLALMGTSVVFSWTGAVIASVVVSFPLMYRTARGAFEQVRAEYIHAARTLGKGEWHIFHTVIIPAAWPGLLSGAVLAFARALGEFGATIMLAGNIPGRTQTMSVAIYSAVQAGNKELAFQWAVFISALSFLLICLMNYFAGLKWRRR